jgi:hypothetical protein
MDSIITGIGLMLLLSLIVAGVFWILVRRFFGGDQLDVGQMQLPILPLVIILMLILLVMVGGVMYSINGDEWNLDSQKVQDATLIFLGLPIISLLIYREIITPLVGVLRNLRKQS